MPGKSIVPVGSGEAGVKRIEDKYLNESVARGGSPDMLRWRGEGHEGVAGVLRAARPGARAGRKRNLIPNS
jgi:hypothetical protein